MWLKPALSHTSYIFSACHSGKEDLSIITRVFFKKKKKKGIKTTLRWFQCIYLFFFLTNTIWVQWYLIGSYMPPLYLPKSSFDQFLSLSNGFIMMMIMWDRLSFFFLWGSLNRTAVYLACKPLYSYIVAYIWPSKWSSG